MADDYKQFAIVNEIQNQQISKEIHQPVRASQPGDYEEIDNEIKKDIFKYKFKTTKTPIKLRVVATKNRGISPPKRMTQTMKPAPVKKEEIVRMYMNLNTEIELINRNKGKKILNTFKPKK